MTFLINFDNALMLKKNLEDAREKKLTVKERKNCAGKCCTDYTTDEM